MKRASQKFEKIFQESLTSIEGGQDTLDSILDKYPNLAQDLRPRLEASLWLREQKGALDPRPGFIKASRQYLVSQIREQPALAPGSALSLWGTRLRQLWHMKSALQFATFVLLIVTLVSLGNVVYLSSQLSLPGDPLYTVKRGFEQARLAFTFSKTGDARLYTQLSQRRTSEIVELFLEGRYEDIPAAAGRLERQIDYALRSIDSVAARNPLEAQALSASFEKTLTSEAFILGIILDTSPPQAIPGIRMALQITSQGLAAIHE